MKKIGVLLLAIVMILVSSCTDKQAYTVTGKVTDEELNGQQAYLQELNESENGFNTLDTAIIENGKFIFKGKAGDEPQVKFISIGNAPHLNPAIFILEPGQIEIDIDTIPSVRGTALNNEYQEFVDKSGELTKKMKELGMQYMEASEMGTLTDEQEESMNDEFDSLNEQGLELMYNITKSNMQNPVGEFFFMQFGNNFTEEQLEELLSLARDSFKQKDQIQEIQKYLTELQATAIGKDFIDVTANNPEGKEISLSDYAGKGKVVLVDFWASWCGPCIKEMPNVVAAYNKYKDKGFEIVGISLDEDKEAWIKAIRNLNMSWPQISDLQGWQSELSAPYMVRSIPYTILLDGNGKIIAKNLRGEELPAKLEELLNN